MHNGPFDGPPLNVTERVILERMRVGAQHAMSADFIRDLQVNAGPRIGSHLDEFLVRMQGEMLVGTLGSSSSESTQRAEITRVPDGRWQMFRASLGLTHRTKPIYADVRTVVKQQTVVPFGISATGLVPTQPGCDRVMLAYTNYAMRDIPRR